VVVGLDHAGITVASLERSLVFYRDLLGLQVIEISADVDVASITGVAAARVKAADLDAGDGRVLELLEYVSAKGAEVHQQPNGAGCAHIALRVLDIAAALRRLAAAGYQPTGVPTELRGAVAWHGATVAYLRDPDGAVVELVQRAGSGGAGQAAGG
jgi:catechol 2,3-dioxygenase-like lactoylglutathione lyase family enzyme